MSFGNDVHLQSRLAAMVISEKSEAVSRLVLDIGNESKRKLIGTESMKGQG